MKYITIVGLIAGALTVISFLPQVLRIYKTKHARDISMTMWVIFLASTVLWIVYGVLTNSIPVIAANIIICALCSSIIIMKIRYK
jgi:MtN3 and saliva related transmembrane protein